MKKTPTHGNTDTDTTRGMGTTTTTTMVTMATKQEITTTTKDNTDTTKEARVDMNTDITIMDSSSTKSGESAADIRENVADIMVVRVADTMSMNTPDTNTDVADITDMSIAVNMVAMRVIIMEGTEHEQTDNEGTRKGCKD